MSGFNKRWLRNVMQSKYGLEIAPDGTGMAFVAVIGDKRIAGPVATEEEAFQFGTKALIDAQATTIATLREAGKWIPVSESLPKPKRACWLAMTGTDGARFVGEGYLESHNAPLEWYSDTESGQRYIDWGTVTHWKEQAIPQLPEAEAALAATEEGK